MLTIRRNKKTVKRLSDIAKNNRKNAIKNRFIGYIDNRKSEIINALHVASQNTPPCINDWDKRFIIGEITVKSLVYTFSSLNDVSNKHYDMIFRPNGKKISIKSGNRMFCRLKEDDPFKPPYSSSVIQVKNRNGDITSSKKAAEVIQNDDWDWMLVSQRQSKKDDIYATLGIVSFKTVQKKCYKAKNGQIQVKLKNSDYDYFWKSPIMLDEYNEDEISDINIFFSKGFDKLIKDTIFNNRISLM